MKSKYLSQIDKANLKALKLTDDKAEIIEILENLLRRKDFTVQVLWEYRKYFQMFSDEELKQNPIIACGRIQIEMCAGNNHGALRIVELLDKDSKYYTLSYITIPSISFEDFRGCAKKILDNNWQPYNFFLTLGRPSIRNGYWDLTRFHDFFVENKDIIVKILDVMYPNDAINIYDMLIAEGFYQRDRCYEALVKVVGLIPFLREKQDFRLLFAAVTLETYILVVNGNASSTEPFMENLGETFIKNGMGEYIPNMKALDVWAAMYDGNYKRVNTWLQKYAPNENKPFCMFELFSIMVKIRAYIIQGKHLEIADLTIKMMPILEDSKRTMDICELCLLNAMSNYSADRKDVALEYLEKAVALSRKYRYDRLIGDEGKRAYDLMSFYIKKKGSDPYVESLKAMAKKTMLIHPNYLKSHVLIESSLTKTEMLVLNLISKYASNEDIANELGIAVTTVKKHCQNIFRKLEVKNRYQALAKAIEMGLIKEQ